MDAEGSLEEQRNWLFEKLNLLAEASHLNFVVVLDAHHAVGELERHHCRSLEIVYTDFDQTADDYIVERVEGVPLSKRHRLKVVTSDKFLTQKVRLERVEVLSVSAFFEEMERKKRSVGVKKEDLHKHVLPSKTKNDSSSPHLGDNMSWTALFESRFKETNETPLQKKRARKNDKNSTTAKK